MGRASFGWQDHDCGILRWPASRGFHNHGTPGQARITPAAPAPRETPAADTPDPARPPSPPGHAGGWPGGDAAEDRETKGARHQENRICPASMATYAQLRIPGGI